MLKVDKLHGKDFMRYVSLGPSVVSHKSQSPPLCHSSWRMELIWPVKNDTFRTLATDTQFKGKVKEEMLIRLLDAFIWKNHGAPLLRSSRPSWLSGSEREGLPFTYVQGMSPDSTRRWSLMYRDERPVSSIPIYYAISTGSFRLFFQLYRKHMSIIRSTDFGRCTPRIESKLSYFHRRRY